MRILSILLACASILACSGRRISGSLDAGTSSEAGLDGAPLDGGSGDGALADASTDAAPLPEEVVIYAHSSDTLYAFSPWTLTVSEIGPFVMSTGESPAGIFDLAVDREGNVFVADVDALFSVDPLTAQITRIGAFGVGSEQLNALSFLAPGEVGSGQALLGATNAGAYYLVDRSTGAASFLGQYPDGWLSSGDIVSVEGLGTFATVKRPDFPSDVLVQLLFAADGSSAVSIKGPIKSATQDFTRIFGVGYWGRVLYGFSAAGELIEIDRDTGAGQIVSATTGTSQFWGAGVTTRVPVLF